MPDEVIGAMQTPDGQWRVEIVRRPGRSQWYRIVHGEEVIDWLSIAAVERILDEAGIERHSLMDTDPSAEPSSSAPRGRSTGHERDLTKRNAMTTDRATGPNRPPRRDDGYTLLEVLVALTVIGTVMAGAVPFLIKSMALVGQNRTQQVAVEVANDALERARALSPSSLFAGRGVTAMRDQLAAAPPQVKALLSSAQLDADFLLTGVADALAGASAPLPTAPVTITVGGIAYAQSWYVGKCWQTKVNPGSAGSPASTCMPSPPTGVGVVSVPFFRVVVAVTWKHRACPGESCVYVASTLVSPSSDPVFDLKRPPPTIASPGSQNNYLNDTVSLQLVAAGGTLPRMWTLTGLPAGLTSATSGLITGKPTTAGTYTVAAHVQDREGNSDDATFTWTVAALPALTSPGAQVFRTVPPTSLPITLTGGLAPFAWTASGLPAGLIIDPLTGVISGAPQAVQTTSQTATVTVVAKGRTASTTFTWRALTPVRLMNPGLFSATRGDSGVYNLGPLASGGLTPYTWKATGLPPGVTINTSTGATSGVIAAGTRYVVTVEVTDAAGGTASQTTLLSVASRTGTDLQVTTPSSTAPDQTTAVGAAVSLTATAAGQSGLSWSATNLPPGLSISTGGVISGAPTAAGTYLTTLTVTGGGQVANLMLSWRVTP